ncbi:hypothetical protein [Arthrobacter sp. NyZ413]|uniref:hypothetical protein n=1 Tax=Arthrobacter sp. NyZ413 TaxID=3144669 RepID=UPI003BF8E4F0
MSTLKELYAEELNTRLAEWQSSDLEPPFRFGDMRTLLVITVALPAFALVMGWFV